MHEVSVMAQIVDEILKIAGKNRAESVEKVVLEVGDLTFLGTEQLRFAYAVLSQDSILRNSAIVIRKIKGRIKCQSCGYEGALGEKGGISHFSPIFTCPKCGGKVTVVSGRECVLRSMRLKQKTEKSKPSGKRGKKAVGKRKRS